MMDMNFYHKGLYGKVNWQLFCWLIGTKCWHLVAISHHKGRGRVELGGILGEKP